MRFSIIVITLLGAIASVIAQSPYPACANPCLLNANSTGCVPSNLQCLCQNQAFVKETTACFYASCTGTDLQLAVDTARGVCEKIGVTLTSSPAHSPTSSSTASTKSGALSTSLSYSALLGLGAAALIGIYL